MSHEQKHIQDRVYYSAFNNYTTSYEENYKRAVAVEDILHNYENIVEDAACTRVCFECSERIGRFYVCNKEVFANNPLPRYEPTKTFCESCVVRMEEFVDTHVYKNLGINRYDFGDVYYHYYGCDA